MDHVIVFLGSQSHTATHFGVLEKRKAIRTFLSKCTVISFGNHLDIDSSSSTRVYFYTTFKMIMKQYEEPAKDALVIEAISHQWWWEFKYPEYGITTANEMYVPADRNITVKLKSADVIHSFWIPVGVARLITYQALPSSASRPL